MTDVTNNIIPCPVAEAARKWPDDPAMITGEEVITWSQYNDQVFRATQSLKENCVHENSRVGLLLENSADYAVLLMALFRLRAVAVPITSRIPSTALPGPLQLARYTHLITNRISEIGSPASGIKLLATSELLHGESKHKRIPVELDLNQQATIIATSGSTSQPKLVLHAYKNHYFNALGSNQNIPFGPGDRWLLSLPLFHVGGIGILFRSLLNGGAVVFPDPNKSLTENILNHDISHISLVSTQLRRLLHDKDKLPALADTLKAVLMGGSAIPDSLLTDAIDAGLTIFKSYGLSEMASQVTTTRPDDLPARLTTSGRPLDYREVKISSDGEIFVCGETRFMGYVNGDNLITSFDDDGWFATGDCGFIDDEGYLTVTGRKDNMFVSGGENIHPEEIESTLSNIPGIEEIVVVAVEHPDYGHRPVAFVHRTDGTPPDSEELTEYLEKSLPRFKIPDRFFGWPENIEKTGIKLNREQFAQLAARLMGKKS